MKKKKILLTLAVASMMGLAGCGETPAPSPSTPDDPPVVVVDPVVTGITLKAAGDKTSLEVGETLQFTATVTGEGEYNKQVTYSVDKSDVAEISSAGLLTAKDKGTVRVTATSVGDSSKKASLDITIIKAAVTGITLKAEGDATSVQVSQTLKFTATVAGEGSFDNKYTFSVDKTDIATISSEGVLTGKAVGTVTVTATATGDTSKTASLEIAVTAAPISKIKDITVGAYVHILGKVTAIGKGCYIVDDGTGAMQVWYKGYDGNVPEAITIGKVIELAGIVDDYYGVKRLKAAEGQDEYFVYSESTETISGTLLDETEKTTAAAYDGEAETITSLKPIKFRATATKTIEGYTSDINFKVDDTSTHVLHPSYTTDEIKGKLTEGTLVDVSGYIAPYHSTNKYNQVYIASVSIVPVAVTSITVNAAGGATSVGLNETLQMSVAVAPEKATNKAVIWSVDKPAIATISEDGVLTGVAPGTVVVTATAADGSGVTGAKSIEVLQFKDPVVSLTLGTAPTEMVVGDDDVDVTVTVAGESSTSNFNPAYSATSSDDEVATVQATATGISIHPVAAGTVTITVKTTGTNADGEQITKTISLEILGEPRLKTMTVAEASAWRPEDTSTNLTLKNEVVSITGYASTEGTGDGTLYLVDNQGNAVQIYKAVSDGTYTYNTATRQYSFAKGGTATDADHAALKGKQVTVKGFLSFRVSGLTYSIEITNGIVVDVSENPVSPTFIKDIRGEGTADVDYTAETAYEATVTVSNVAPAEGYALGSIILDNGTNIKKLSANAGNYTFTAKGFNKIIINFVKSSELTANTVSQVLTRSEETDMDHKDGRNPYSEFFKMTGVLKAITNQTNFIVADPDDPTKAINVYDGGTLKTKYNAGELGIGYQITVVGQLGYYNNVIQVTNIVESSGVDGGITGYHVTAAEVQNGTVVSILAGGNPVGPNDVVAPGTVLTVTLAPEDKYSAIDLSANNSAIVTPNPSNDNEYTVKVYGDTILTPDFAKDVTKVSKTTNDLATEYSWVTSSGPGSHPNKYPSFELDSHIAISTHGTGDCGTVWGSSPKDWRLYQASGADLVVTAADGYELKWVTFTYNVSNSGVLLDGETRVTSNTKYKASGSSITFTVGNTANKTNGQVKVTSFSVIYAKIPTNTN